MRRGEGWTTDELPHIAKPFFYMKIVLSASENAIFAAVIDPVHMEFVGNQIQKTNFYIRKGNHYMPEEPESSRSSSGSTRLFTVRRSRPILRAASS